MSKAGIAARGAAWSIASSLLSRALGLVGTLVLIRFVAPDGYGEASAATVVVTTVNQMTTLGVGVYVIANRGATREDMFHATFVQIALGVLAFVALLFVGKPLSPLFDTPEMYRYVPGLALAALTERVAFMPERILIRNLKFRRISVIRSLGEFVYTTVSVGTAWLGWGAMSIVAGNLARSVVKTVVILAAVAREEWLWVVRLRLEVLRRIVSYGFSITLGGLAASASRRWDNLLVSRFFGPAIMGTYNLSYNLADIPAVQIGEQITDVMQASFAQMDPQERRNTLLRSLSAIGLVAFPIAVGLGALAPTLAQLFLDKKWSGVGPMLSILSTLSVVRPIYGAMSSFIVVERGPRPLVVLEWLTLALLMGLIVTIGRLSPLWICVAVGISFTMRSIAGMSLASKGSGISIAAMLGRLMPPLIACVPMTLVVFALRRVLPRLGSHSPTVLLAASVVTGGAAYIATALLLAPGPTSELLALLKKTRPTPTDPSVVAGDAPISQP